jgi:pimeloyl-ACP methyl ester carboxylesterase
MLPSLTPPAPVSTSVLVSADGEHAALHDLGGDGPALLLSHGNGLNAGMWRAVVRHLQGHFHCHGLDLRGHGANRPTRPDYDVGRERFAEDVRAAIDALGGQPVFYAAHSLGGASGLFAARRWPELFRAMWLFEPVVLSDQFAREGPPSFLVEASRRRRMEFDSAEQAIANFAAKPPFDACEPEALRGYVEFGSRSLPDGRIRLSCEGEDEARVFETGEPVPFATLASIVCPVVVARGSETAEAHAIPAAMAAPIAEALPSGRLETFEGLTHFGPMEDAEAIARSILAHFVPLI